MNICKKKTWTVHEKNKINTCNTSHTNFVCLGLSALFQFVSFYFVYQFLLIFFLFMFFKDLSMSHADLWIDRIKAGKFIKNLNPRAFLFSILVFVTDFFLFILFCRCVVSHPIYSYNVCFLKQTRIEFGSRFESEINL